MLRADPALARQIADALAEEVPLFKRDGGFVRQGYDAALDETRALRDESRRVIAALQTRYAEEADCRTLRIKHNNMLGFFVEVPQSAGERFLKEPLAGTFMHRQTMAGAMRFSTVELGELESRIASAADKALAIELDVFARLSLGISRDLFFRCRSGLYVRHHRSWAAVESELVGRLAFWCG